jgi:signal transduction histidine kinase
MRPRPTLRLRLTVTYGLVFLVTGAILLTIGYVLVRSNIQEPHILRKLDSIPPPFPNTPTIELIRQVRAQLVSDALHRLLIEYLFALGVMTMIAMGTGWLLAGRALRPLREIISTARRVSGQNLGERIGLRGPADELKELADTFDGMLGRLDGAFASQRHFVANASHELRTPLAIMRTEVDVALADPSASREELRSMGEAVRETIDRCEQLIESLLMLARSEGKAGREEPTDLAAIAADCVTDMRARADDAAVELRARLEPAGVRGEPGLLERMVANLIDNGIQHNERGGFLDVETDVIGGRATLRLVNGGEPIKPVDAVTLTDPFRRLDRGSGGFGLGLSIVRSVIDVHGGTLEVRARETGGLEVLVSLAAANVSIAQSPAALTES